MVAKKRQELVRKRSAENFEAKGVDSEGNLVIEGYFNKATVDDAKDIIKPKAWNLVRYMKNPMVLFNHNPDYPIGKTVEIEQREDGLWGKILISNSKTEKAQYVRDMIVEGILKTYSVGFETEQAEKSKAEGGKEVNAITKAKLHEVSVVSLPMNEDSTFSHSAKSLNMKNWTSYKKAVEDVLECKGAWVAAAVHNAIYSAQEEGKDKEALYEQVMEKAEISKEQLLSILAGEVTPIEGKVLEAFAAVFEMDLAELQSLDAGDVKLGEKKEEEPKEEEEKPEAEKEPMEHEEPMMEEHKEEKAEGNSPYQQCVHEKIPKLIEEGKTQEQAVAMAMSMCKEGKSCDVDFNDKDLVVKFIEFANKCLTEKQGLSPIGSSSVNENFDTGSPHLELMKQNIVMLGVIANELKLISQKLDGMPARAIAQEQEQKPAEQVTPVETGKSEHLDLLKKAFDTIDNAVRDLGY